MQVQIDVVVGDPHGDGAQLLFALGQGLLKGVLLPDTGFLVLEERGQGEVIVFHRQGLVVLDDGMAGGDATNDRSGQGDAPVDGEASGLGGGRFGNGFHVDAPQKMAASAARLAGERESALISLRTGAWVVVWAGAGLACDVAVAEKRRSLTTS